MRDNKGKFIKGTVPWNKGKSVWYKGQKLTEDHKRKIGISNKGKKQGKGFQTEKSKEKIRKSLTGHKVSKLTRERISRGLMKVGIKEWKGFKSNKREKYNHSVEYKLWREAIFKRDNYTCVWCGKKNTYLEADHIQRWVDCPELRLAIDNGRTLCKKCHKIRHFERKEE